ncbi:class I SAM-dependent methyltransferase [Nocardia sp. CDC159]|uniref:Class I SAM-dependent methyltransferase n=1 Tax=Nocardia pulmonis TaxID=2951408 RepID=A0A9X2E3Q8_9NOCA|nr:MULTISPECIES: class I SAM-dependent methyltransferase [Nocardia]MCM6773727.1 class I SAM-dependent methyltransferase [Nocardia pulmonis]MCM6786614.1 class I SAM-dependent methyltransferase [Nocardia sp. CDC159]
MTQTAEFWNTVYDNDTAPWVIGAPQPAIMAVADQGLIRGRVLDPGCGAGEHTIALTRLGYDVLGVDLAPSAIAYARRNAEAKGVPGARFEVADAVRIGADPEYAARFGLFDTVVDSALFHIFLDDPGTRAAYVRSLHTLLRPGGVLHLLALSDAEPGFGPRISDTMIRESFTEGWDLEELRPSHYTGRITDTVAEDSQGLDVAADGTVRVSAWLARIRRR